MKKLSLIVLLVLLSGCASTKGWTPTIDVKHDADSTKLSVDIAECKDLADKAAGTFSTIAEDALVTSVVGTAAGAATGAGFGVPHIGAAVGASTGILGGLYGGFTADQEFKNAYKSCLRQRGHRVL